MARGFRAAADAGFADSQYNLARLYEAGSGVPRDLRAAERLYRQAAAQGDAAAAARADALAAKLASAGGESAARPGPAIANLTPGAVLDAQKTLSRLGYYVGPVDGVDSPALQDAIARYARDAGMSPQVVPSH